MCHLNKNKQTNNNRLLPRLLIETESFWGVSLLGYLSLSSRVFKRLKLISEDTVRFS